MSGNLYIAVRGEAAPAPHLQSAREAACVHLDREGAANVAFGYGENTNLVYPAPARALIRSGGLEGLPPSGGR